MYVPQEGEMPSFQGYTDSSLLRVASLSFEHLFRKKTITPFASTEPSTTM
jgi:hypothetical protein